MSSGGAVERCAPIEVTRPGTGAQVGEYRIVRSLGAGGMGQVFAAQRVGGGELVALKQVAVVEPTALYRFKQEFRSLADLPHPNLVRLGELVVLAEGLAFFTMELVEGEALARWVRRAAPAGTAPNIHRLCHALRQLAAGVSHLHRAARVHRDLKPSNVLVTAEGRVVILDFGLVYELSEDNARITATGQLLGTPAYMAPEQLTRCAIGPALDLYAIGVTLFECLTGCMPFAGSTSGMLADKQQEPAPDPRELAEGIPNWLAQLCRALLDIEPVRRPSADEVVAILDRHIEAAPLSVVIDEARGPRLFGRERELATLEHAHQQVASEGATVVRLTGPLGRGKSALVVHFLQSVREPDAVVLRGRCHPRESVPYKGVDTIVDALALHLRTLPAVEAAALRPRHVRELCELFPVLRGIWREPGRLAVEHEPVVRRRLGVEALRDVLARIGDASALVMVIDDFHFGDLDGLDVLVDLISRPGDRAEGLLHPPSAPAMLLLLAYDAQSKGAVVGPLEQADTLRGTRTIELELQPLDEHDARALARALIDPRIVDDPELAARQLATASRGEPLAIVRGATAGKPTDVSVAADGEVLRRVRALDPERRALLELTTIAEVPLPNELVRKVLGSDVANFEVAACDLVMAGLLGAVALESRGVIKLARPRIGELVRVELDGTRRARLHLRLAETLAERSDDPELIAEHFERGGDRERARGYMTEAARRAADALAFVRAERLYRRALELLPRGFDAERKTERRQLQLALADQLVHLARSPEAAELYAEAAGEHPREQASKLRLRAAEQYAIASGPTPALPLLRQLMREAGERLPDSWAGALASSAWNRLRLRIAGRRVQLREASEIAPELLTRFDLVHATNLALHRREPLLSAALRPRVMQLALAAGDPLRLVVALQSEVALLTTAGQFDRAAGQLAEARAIAERSDDPLIQAHVHATAHFYQVRLSKVDEAEASFRAAMSCIERCPGESGIQAALFHSQAMLLRQAGAYQRLRVALPGWIDRSRDLGQRQHEILLIAEDVIVHAQLGDCALARRRLARARANWADRDFELGIAEIWLLRARGQSAKAVELARRTRHDLRRQGLASLLLPRLAVLEAHVYAQLGHAIASHDRALAPQPGQLRRLRRSGLPRLATTALVLEAGRASLLGERERELELWREALGECESQAMHALAAAMRWRLAELEVDDAGWLGAEARAYFREQNIEDAQHFVDLLAPAARPRSRNVQTRWLVEAS